ncbi:uncharacterized protein LOC135379041 isoform X2 [Ornithodoros turicata]|uniref:uncharacterized protein LOC135379041 isoform X2 n=1 Tax=Ornithodoros turicata TaxID=34597 RepID=UPI0031391932
MAGIFTESSQTLSENESATSTEELRGNEEHITIDAHPELQPTVAHETRALDTPEDNVTHVTASPDASLSEPTIAGFEVHECLQQHAGAVSIERDVSTCSIQVDSGVIRRDSGVSRIPEQYSEDVLWYDMAYKNGAGTRGKCVIFNFSKVAGYPERIGTKKDEEVIRTLFGGQLGFDVDVHDEKTKEEMLKKLEKLADEDHSSSCCLCLFLLSHGNDDAIICKDGEKIQLSHVYSTFDPRNCKGLAGKPKLFFVQGHSRAIPSEEIAEDHLHGPSARQTFQHDPSQSEEWRLETQPTPATTKEITQACRGKEIDTGIQHDGPADTAAWNFGRTLPIYADFFVFYATCPGVPAYRDENHGSLFIQTLCEVLAKEFRHKDFLTMMTLVKHCVSDEDISVENRCGSNRPMRVKQMPHINSTLRKNLHFAGQGMDSGAYPVIVRPSHNPDCLELGNDNLARLLTDPVVADLPVVVLSVAGGFRLGKSFLLGFCIRYLEHLETSSHPSGWMDKDNIPLTGFSWKYGSKRHTTGIHLWGKVFKIKTPKHGLVAVVLMDTEGAFDNRSTLEGNVTIFSVSMLLSSVQVYNLNKQITQSDLEHLKLFAEYASMARSKERQGNEVFQKLLFLIRDWQYPGEEPFGLEGGQELLDPWLERNHTLPREVYELRENISSSFAEVRCFLLPRPGDAIENSSFDGKLRDLSTDFKCHIKDLVPFLLSPETVVPKKINGRIVTCKELVCMFQAYFSVFNHKELPQPMSIFNATAFIHNKRIMDKIVGKYDNAMEAIVHSNSDTDIQMEHDRLTRECLSVFQDEQKMGKHDAELREQLTKDLNARYDLWRHARDMWRKYTHDMEHRFGEEREKAKRDFQETLEQHMEDERKKYEEHMDSMARTHSLDVEQMKKAMETASLKNRIWDIGLAIANALPGLCQAGVGLLKISRKYPRGPR